MKKTFFIADTHFGHKNIITSCNRPFKNVEDMNKTLILNRNNIVGERDIVYHLGDVFGYGKKETGGLIYALKGKKILLRGNHDYFTAEDYISMGFDQCHGMNEMVEIPIGMNRLFLSHHPPKVDDIHDNGIYLFGHLHDKFDEIERQFPYNVFCASVERISYQPIEFSRIIASLAKQI